MPAKLKFREKNKLFCKKPDNPSNINWQNLEKGIIKRCFLFFIATIVIIFILVIAMAIIVILQSFKSKYTKNLSEEGNQPCQNEISITEFTVTWNDYQNTNIPKIESYLLSDQQKTDKGNFEFQQRCFCEEQDFFDMIKENTLLNTYCGDFAEAEVIKMSVSVLTSFLISIINYILVLLIGRVVLIATFKTLSSQIATQLMFITIAVFINSLVIKFLKIII